MTLKSKLEELKHKDKINILINVGNVKNKLLNLINHLKRNCRFNVILGTTCRDINLYYKKIDLFIPEMPYQRYITNNNDILNHLIDNKKIIMIKYSLGWHNNIKDLKEYKFSFLNFVDSKDLCFDDHYIYTGHPYIEELLKDSTCFKNPWKTNKKRILICPHWTIKKYVGHNANYSNLLCRYSILMDCILKYKDKCEFVIRPHPNLYDYWIGNYSSFMGLYNDEDHKIGSKAKDILNNLSKYASIVMDNNQIGWFKYSDALIHDCGSFRCEYLYMNKPVCFLCNDINMNSKKWTQMGKDAISCHEKCWNDEDLENFIVNVINNVDYKLDERLEFKKRYIDIFINNKTPSQNIIDYILGV